MNSMLISICKYVPGLRRKARRWEREKALAEAPKPIPVPENVYMLKHAMDVYFKKRFIHDLIPICIYEKFGIFMEMGYEEKGSPHLYVVTPYQRATFNGLGQLIEGVVDVWTRTVVQEWIKRNAHALFINSQLVKFIQRPVLLEPYYPPMPEDEYTMPLTLDEIDDGFNFINDASAIINAKNKEIEKRNKAWEKRYQAWEKRYWERPAIPVTYKVTCTVTTRKPRAKTTGKPSTGRRPKRGTNRYRRKPKS